MWGPSGRGGPPPCPPLSHILSLSLFSPAAPVDSDDDDDALPPAGDGAAAAAEPASDGDGDGPVDDSVHTFDGHGGRKKREREREGERDNKTRHDSSAPSPFPLDAVFAVAWNPAHPSIVATGGGDDRAFLWRVGSADGTAELGVHGDTVCCAAFAPNGASLATGSLDGCVRLWDGVTGAPGHNAAHEILRDLKGRGARHLRA
jgi:hypothetical protein